MTNKILISAIFMSFISCANAGALEDDIKWFLAADFSGVRLSDAPIPQGNDSVLGLMNRLLPDEGGTDEVSVASSYHYKISERANDTVELLITFSNYVKSIYEEKWLPQKEYVLKIKVSKREGFLNEFTPVVSPQALYRHYKYNSSLSAKKFADTLCAKLKSTFTIREQ